MPLCEMCMRTISRLAILHRHVNRCQPEQEHVFCSHECKILWVHYVRKNGLPKVNPNDITVWYEKENRDDIFQQYKVIGEA